MREEGKGKGKGEPFSPLCEEKVAVRSTAG